MPIAKQTIDIPLGGGLEGKVDSKLVPPGKSIVLENAEFSAPGAINKRNGYTALSKATIDSDTLTAARSLFQHKGELLMLSNADGLSAMPSGATKWTKRLSDATVASPAEDLKAFALTAYTKQIASTSWGHVAGPVDVAYANGFIAMAAIAGTSSFHIWTTIIDATSGAIVWGPKKARSGALTAASRVRVVSSGNYLYAVAVDAGTLSVSVFDTTSATIQLIETYTSSIGAHVTFWDVANLDSAGKCVLVYRHTTPDVRALTFNNSAVVISPTVIAADTVSSQIGVVVTGGNVFAAYRESGNDLRCVGVTAALVSVFASTSLGVSDATIGYVCGVVDIAVASSIRWLYTTTAASVRTISEVTITTAGVAATPQVLLAHARIISAPFTYNSDMFFVAAISIATTSTTGQSGVYLFNRTHQSVAFGTGYARPVARVLWDETVNEGFYSGAPPPTVGIATDSAGKFWCGSVFLGAQSLIIDAAAANLKPAASLVTYDFTFRPSAAALGENLLINSGLLLDYDGQNICENNFLVYPEGIVITDSGVGSLADGIYQFVFAYGAFDASGQLHMGPTTAPVSLTTSGGLSAITFSAPDLSGFTLRRGLTGLRLFAYVTELGGSTFYEFCSNAGATVTTFQTTSGLTDNRTLYTTGGVLDNSAPPPLTSIVRKGKRLYGVDHKGVIWYTKEHVRGEGVAWVQETLVKDPGDDDATHILAEMDGRLIDIGETRIFVLSGEGLNDTGSVDTLSEPQEIATDLGASSNSPVVTTPAGVMYKSPRGIVLLDRSLSVRLIGAPVDSYKALTTVSAVLVPSKNQVRFGHSDGSTLVYDYLMDQWSVFTNHTQVAAAYYESLYCFVTSAGQVYQQSTGFVDNATSITKAVETPWVHVGSVQGFQRVLLMSILGEWRSSHTLTATIYYDHLPTAAETVTWELTSGYSANDPLQVRHRMGNQCRAVKVRIEDSSQSGTKESLSLAMLSLELGGKEGVFRLGTAQTA